MDKRIRRFRTGDEAILRTLFFDTIRNVNRRDYTEEQVRAWAPEDYEPEHWAHRMRELNPFVCEVDGEIAGYADLQSSGYIDHFFVSKNFQRRGVGTSLFERIEAEARARQLKELSADVSITARPFFERFGFAVIRQQQVTINDVVLTNFRMVRKIS
ncbi:MAG: GNAT family N-acetyltransferase [Woeseiaceae bacterium]|nr:GNAT family N-acetyltransferase [Woeseiaceae bacterium]